MSQLILDEQLTALKYFTPLGKWFSLGFLQDLRPGERILDDRVPQILLTLNRPTFVTIDQDYWHRHLCHPRYCILCFAIPNEEPLPGLLRGLLRRSEFHTRVRRMGKVVRVQPTLIDYWEFGVDDIRRIRWSGD